MQILNKQDLLLSILFFFSSVLKIQMILCLTGSTVVTKEHTAEPGISPKHRDGLQRD